MTGPVSYEAFRRRFDADEEREAAGASFVTERELEAALDVVGWRAAGRDTAAVAGLLAMIFRACATGHRRLDLLHEDVADLLRHYARGPDGSLPPVAALAPVARDVVRRYVTSGARTVAGDATV